MAVLLAYHPSSFNYLVVYTRVNLDRHTDYLGNRCTGQSGALGTRFIGLTFKSRCRKANELLCCRQLPYGHLKLYVLSLSLTAPSKPSI